MCGGVGVGRGCEVGGWWWPGMCRIGEYCILQKLNSHQAALHYTPSGISTQNKMRES